MAARIQPWFARILALCPLLIAILWVAGIVHFRDYTFSGSEWAVLVASAFALHTLSRLATRSQPLPPLPAGSNPATLAALAAAIFAVAAAVIGGLAEWLIQAYQPSATPWALRTAWHAACVFGGMYCENLRRLGLATPSRPKPN